jgi:outer membrane protein OmpA-like peptidoglycan-associated protein
MSRVLGSSEPASAQAQRRLGPTGAGLRVRAVMMLLAGVFAQGQPAAQTPADTSTVLSQPSIEALQRAFGARPSASEDGPDSSGIRKPRLRSIVVDSEPSAPPRTVAIAIPFQINSANLSTAAVDVLDRLASVLREVTQHSRVIIEGHTDATGSADINRRLSLARAQTVLRALATREVSMERLQVEGNGADHLLVDRAPADPAHRRVQFRVEPIP